MLCEKSLQLNIDDHGVHDGDPLGNILHVQTALLSWYVHNFCSKEPSSLKHMYQKQTTVPPIHILGSPNFCEFIDGSWPNTK